MKEYKFVLPLGHDHEALEQVLLDLFGGFTALDGFGAWQADDGTTHKEQVRVYHVATSYRSMLLGCAMVAARQAKQIALYFDGETYVCD